MSFVRRRIRMCGIHHYLSIVSYCAPYRRFWRLRNSIKAITDMNRSTMYQTDFDGAYTAKDSCLPIHQGVRPAVL